MKPQYSAVILGVGPERGLGATLAKFIAAKGLHVFLAGRSKDKLQDIADIIENTGGSATVVVANATLEEDINALFNTIQTHDSQLLIGVYNVDSNIPASILDTDSATFNTLWQQNCYGAFLFGKACIANMKPHQQGTLFFTGATASLRAKPPFTAFASAKSALRALAQGMAREFFPEGIHVIHTIIDGVIDGDRAVNDFPEYVKSKGKEGLLDLQAIAETYWALHCQHPSAWTHELDLRPFKEPF